MKLTKENILKAMIKGGNNPEKSKMLINKHFDYINRVYDDITPKEASNIILTIQ